MKQFISDPVFLTVWKFWNFLIIQILREINFGEFRGSKIAVFAIYWAYEFC